MQWNRLEGKTIKDKGVGQERYEILKTIGNGGAGMVYLAHDLKEDRHVALKVCDPSTTMSNAKQRFEMEARILSKLNSQHIIAFYDSFTQDGTDMIVMEYVEGVSLDDKLKREKRIQTSETIHIITQILIALEEVHHHKVFHRDIKPDNIHITVDGQVKLLDFGIIQESSDQNLTKEGNVIGTISYLAPEIIRAPQRKASTKTDVYSVGIMMYELLTGVKPFKSKPGISDIAQRNNDLAMNIITATVVTPNEMDATIDPLLSSFVMKMLSRDPSDRYQSAADALDDLSKIQKGQHVPRLQSYNEEEEVSSSNKQIAILGSIAAATVIFFIIAVVIMIASM